MKTTKICIRFAVILTAVAGFATPVLAQAPAPRLQNFAAGERFFPMLNRVLTDEQRNSLRAAMEIQRDKIQPLNEKLRASRQALLDEIAGGRFDENVVRQNATASAQAETELTVIYARALSQIQPPLSLQQIQQLKNPPPGQFQPPAAPKADAAPEKHLGLPPPLPRDANDLPVVK